MVSPWSCKNTTSFARSFSRRPLSVGYAMFFSITVECTLMCSKLLRSMAPLETALSTTLVSSHSRPSSPRPPQPANRSFRCRSQRPGPSAGLVHRWPAQHAGHRGYQCRWEDGSPSGTACPFWLRRVAATDAPAISCPGSTCSTMRQAVTCCQAGLYQNLVSALARDQPCERYSVFSIH